MISPVAHDVFLMKNQPRYRNLGLEVYVTFFEIYNGKVAAKETLFILLGPLNSKTLKLARNGRSPAICELWSFWATLPLQVGGGVIWWWDQAQQVWQEHSSELLLRR